MKQFETLLQNQGGNHIFPFLWVHGEDEKTLRAEVARIRESGIKAFCVEARPHNDFNGEGWFRDLGILLDECRQHDMEMWILDDSHFPTGYADGAVKKYHPELCKKFLYCKLLDFAGPVKNAAAVLKYALRTPKDQILSIRLYRKTGFETIDLAESLDLTDQLEWYADAQTGQPVCDMLGRPLPDGSKYGECPAVRFDLPEGEWTLAVTAVSFQGGEKQTAGYLNPIDPAATQVLLDTVYQPIYEHFGEEFGKRIRGFFSDEPRFGNIHGAEDASIGRNSQMDLPWRDGMAEMLSSELEKTALHSQDIVPLLPLLFIQGAEGEADEAAHILRYAYMDLVSRLYSEHFDGVLAAWCHAHGCEHIGHIIEDNNATARLGYGAGHYFRAVAHQDMAGIDVVIQQLTPGQDSGWFKGMHNPGWDGEFFNYVLGKLGGSLAHLDEKKKGRCMCELFGAYGWAEGNRLCKWLADYMLVRGVNEFVPHAFDPAPFPDADCPPHFYADGHNPQYPEFRILMEYMNRMSEALNGEHVAPVALLYHAEGEWSGEYMLTQKPAAAMAKSFIDYDIVPADYLPDGAVENGSLTIGYESFRALVIPYAQALPAALLEKVCAYAAAGLAVYFVDGLPERTSEGLALPQMITGKSLKVVPLSALADTLYADGIPELTLTEKAPYLRYYHVSQPDGEVYFFTNEGLTKIETRVLGAAEGTAYVYDAFVNTLTETKDAFSLKLEPYTSICVVVPGKKLTDTTLKESACGTGETGSQTVSHNEEDASGNQGSALENITLHPESFSLADADTRCEIWQEPQLLNTFTPIDQLPGLSAFAGRIRYTLCVNLSAEQAACNGAKLHITGVQEGAKVTVNNMDCGTRICPPYCYNVSGMLTEGQNTIIIEVNTTQGRRQNDFLSQFLIVEPLGITGGVTLELYY